MARAEWLESCWISSHFLSFVRSARNYSFKNVNSLWNKEWPWAYFHTTFKVFLRFPWLYNISIDFNTMNLQNWLTYPTSCLFIPWSTRRPTRYVGKVKIQKIDPKIPMECLLCKKKLLQNVWKLYLYFLYCIFKTIFS